MFGSLVGNAASTIEPEKEESKNNEHLVHEKPGWADTDLDIEFDHFKNEY